jgi:site-specific recombinase XerD
MIVWRCSNSDCKTGGDDYDTAATISVSHPMTVRQLSRLLRGWVSDAGLDPEKYGIESLRRTKALHILKGTGDIEAVRVLLGHTKIESTARYLRIAKSSDPIAISQAFDI